MTLYHFTLHAFGSWAADHPRGYTVRGQGYQSPSPQEQRSREEKLTQPVVVFDDSMQRILIAGTHDICRRRGWRLLGAANDPTHYHCMIGWEKFTEWQMVRDKLKNVLSLFLGRWTGIAGRTWFVEGGSRKRVESDKHRDYLLDAYFPNHRGVFWREEMPVPVIPQWVLHGKRKPGASASGYDEFDFDLRIDIPPEPDSR